MLKSPTSLKYLTEEDPYGWFCPTAQKYVDWNEYNVDRSKPHWGFKSWNDWFIRTIKPEYRPVDQRENSIVHSSDSYPVHYPSSKIGTNPATNVQA